MEKSKCPHCGCEEIETTTWREDYYVVEELQECKNCKAIKYHWSYGVLFVDNWQESSFENGKSVVD